MCVLHAILCAKCGLPLQVLGYLNIYAVHRIHFINFCFSHCALHLLDFFFFCFVSFRSLLLNPIFYAIHFSFNYFNFIVLVFGFWFFSVFVFPFTFFVSCFML